ncbi:2-hydroxyacid dehydrogenase [Arthrobacter sp. CAU 1506]|uniref:2-hydroxyacid dehydrogenase n=1 Tax=Arthrobacter sp. CAU 1506 TaxID=2560052 RepID=UPI0010AC3BF0|nr:2-hydroxyacid dehydrogenase [Arthrobacter sp. CAU 1506]TJY69152.1 2-hydroxyacid dehydrogenase [Arthrobacter sp. CAU 1506]
MTVYTAAESTSPARPAHQILQVGPVNPAVAATLASEFGALQLPDGPERAEFLLQHADGVRVAVCSGRVGVDTDLMRQLPNLEAIVNFGVGYDASDVKQAKERGIAISNTPDVLTDCVADTALALYLDVLRQTTAADRFVRRGEWESTPSYPLAVRASGKKVGILGLGRIGKAIAKRLQAFGCEIHYHNRRAVEGSGFTYHDSPAALAEAVEVLVVATAGGPATARLVDADVLAKLGSDGYLVNIARGTVVDEQALVSDLVEGRLAGAGLDVFASEPHVPAELFGLENVVLLPHIGSGTHETRADMAALTLENLRSYLHQGSLVTPVS